MKHQGRRSRHDPGVGKVLVILLRTHSERGDLVQPACLTNVEKVINFSSFFDWLVQKAPQELHEQPIINASNKWGWQHMTFAKLEILEAALKGSISQRSSQPIPDPQGW